MGSLTPWNMLSSKSVENIVKFCSVKSVENIVKFRSVKSIENIAKFRRHLKTYIYNLAYPPPKAPWRINQSDDNWICLLTPRSMNPFVLID